jgi:hypothetical protein
VYGYILGNSTADASIGTINKAPALVTANSGSTIYNGALQTISGFSVSGLVGGETIADLPGVSAGASGRNAGSYTTTASGTAANYDLSFVDGVFTINKAPLTISAVTDSRIYDGTTSSIGVPTVTAGQLFSGDTLSGLSQVFGSKNVLGANQSTLSVTSSYTLSDGNSGNNYNVTLATAPGTISKALLTPSFTVNNKTFDGTPAATIADYSLLGIIDGDNVFITGGNAAFDTAFVGNNKLVTIDGFSLSGVAAGNYQLSAPLARGTASISPMIDESFNNLPNPGNGLPSTGTSSPALPQPVVIDNNNLSPSSTLPPAADVNPSGPDLSQPTQKASDVPADSASQEFEESDQRSAELANTSLGLTDASAGVPLSPARLQLLMQSAAALIRSYNVRMPNP